MRAGKTPPPPTPPEPAKPKVKKLRLLFVFGGLSIIAVISTVFGMLMAVASDLPSLDNRAELRRPRTPCSWPTGPAARR